MSVCVWMWIQECVVMWAQECGDVGTRIYVDDSIRDIDNIASITIEHTTL